MIVESGTGAAERRYDEQRTVVISLLICYRSVKCKVSSRATYPVEQTSTREGLVLVQRDSIR
jgi:hypothetical protein